MKMLGQDLVTQEEVDALKDELVTADMRVTAKVIELSEKTKKSVKLLWVAVYVVLALNVTTIVTFLM